MFAANADTTTPYDLASASGRLLQASSRDADASDLFASLDDLDDHVLDSLRSDRNAGRAFWLNVYGAFATRDGTATWDGPQSVRIAGTSIDLEAVEHGILRGGKWKYGLGYVPDFLLDRFVRRHKLADPDPRAHLAIRARRHGIGPAGPFTAPSVERELRAVTDAYLDVTVEYDGDVNVARVPRSLLWFRGDFGGSEGVRSLLHRHEVIPSSSTPTLDYVSFEDADGAESGSQRDRPERTQ